LSLAEPAPISPRDTSPVLRIDALRFGWPRQATLLDIRHFELARSERVFLYGPSGSGKSTLLNLVAGTLAPTSGSVEIAGESMTGKSGRGRDRLRADQLGVVFQMFNLLPYLSVRDNVLLPCHFSRRRRLQAVARHGNLVRAADHLLAALGLGASGIAERSAASLSVGQQQRVAAARALIGDPALVIADEPTSALDFDAREAFLGLLFDECRATGAGLLFVSHDHSLKSQFDRVVALADFATRAAAEITP
jgi:putative ABC transport system ATP-binding protein